MGHDTRVAETTKQEVEVEIKGHLTDLAVRAKARSVDAYQGALDFFHSTGSAKI
jgi:hypothetical protein